MSALGQKQTWRHPFVMSALPPKADIPCREQHVRFVPKADIAVLFDHLVRNPAAPTRLIKGLAEIFAFQYFVRLPRVNAKGNNIFDWSVTSASKTEVTACNAAYLLLSSPPSAARSALHTKRGAPMKFELIVITLLVAAMPVCAQAQAPQAPPPPQAPKASQAPKAPKASPTPKAPKAVKDSKEMTKLAVAQKVVKTISGDKAKTQTYCDIGKLGDQIQEAEKKNDMNKIDELNSKMGGLATNLGPEYVELMSGLEDMDPNSKEAKDIGVVLEGLDKLCAK
ncbi:MAG: hypothetical protein WCC81_23490 [Pseudolabrys sp.]